MNRVKVGGCGFRKASKNYFQQFKLVGIQQTFYGSPSMENAARWREEAPEDFESGLKAWLLKTHSCVEAAREAERSSYQDAMIRFGLCSLCQPCGEARVIRKDRISPSTCYMVGVIIVMGIPMMS